MIKLLTWLSILAIPVYGFWIVPKYNEVKTRKVHLQNLAEESRKKTEEFKTLKAQEKALKSEAFEAILAQVPPTIQQERLIVDLQRIAQESGFIFKSLGFAKGQNPEVESAEVKINFSVRGRKDNLPKFLAKIEQNPRFLGMENLAYSIEDLEGLNVINMSVSVFAFSQTSLP